MFSHIAIDQKQSFIEELEEKGVKPNTTADILMAVGVKDEPPVIFGRSLRVFLCPRAAAMQVADIRPNPEARCMASLKFEVKFRRFAARKLLSTPCPRGFLLLPLTVSRHGNLALVEAVKNIDYLAVDDTDEMVNCSSALAIYLQKHGRQVSEIWHQYIAG